MLNKLGTNKVNVALPDTLNGEQIVEKTNPAYSYTSVSYVLKSGSEVLAEGTATPKNSGSASDPQWSFSIANVLAQPSGTASGYALSVSLVDSDGNTWLAEGGNASVTKAPAEGQTVTAGEASVTKFVEQVATLQVNLTDLATLPTDENSYSVSYIESDKSGKALAGAKTETYALTSKQASAMGTSFSIPDLAVGTYYNVTVEVNTGSAIYSGTALSSETEDQAGTSTVTVKLELKSGTPEPEPVAISVVTSAPVAFTGSLDNVANLSAEAKTFSVPASSFIDGASGNLVFSLTNDSDNMAAISSEEVTVPAGTEITGASLKSSAVSVEDITFDGSIPITQITLTSSFTEAADGQPAKFTVSSIVIDAGNVSVSFTGSPSLQNDADSGKDGTIEIELSASNAEGITVTPTGIIGTINIEVTSDGTDVSVTAEGLTIPAEGLNSLSQIVLENTTGWTLETANSVKTITIAATYDKTNSQITMTKVTLASSN